MNRWSHKNLTPHFGVGTVPEDYWNHKKISEEKHQKKVGPNNQEPSKTLKNGKQLKKN